MTCLTAEGHVAFGVCSSGSSFGDLTFDLPKIKDDVQSRRVLILKRLWPWASLHPDPWMSLLDRCCCFIWIFSPSLWFSTASVRGRSTCRLHIKHNVVLDVSQELFIFIVFASKPLITGINISLRNVTFRLWTKLTLCLILNCYLNSYYWLFQYTWFNHRKSERLWDVFIFQTSKISLISY